MRLFDLDHNSRRQPKEFLSSGYEDEVVVTIDDFLSHDGGAKTLFDRITYAFDVATPDGQ